MMGGRCGEDGDGFREFGATVAVLRIEALD
jgi:hypothetical protein